MGAFFKNLVLKFRFAWVGNRWKQSLFLPAAAAATIAMALVLTVQPQGSGLGLWYEQYAQIIRAGFAAHLGETYPTFPMWGYGFLLALVPHVAGLVFIQIALGIFGTVWLLFSLESTGMLSRKSTVVAMWIVALFLPWHAVFTSAYSAPAIAVGLMLTTFGFLVRYLAQATTGFGTLLLAAVAFGLCLNFRSDYFAFGLIVAVLLLVASTNLKRGVFSASLWLIISGAMLVPWMLYTQHAVGRPLITSTNTGHVLFLSWGDLPDNPWGIHVSDDDPVMQAELQQHFGRPITSLNAESDRYLKARFLEMVREQPGLYLRRLGLQSRNLLLGGFFPGVWDQDFRERVRARFPEENLNTILLKHWRELPDLATSRTLLQLLGEIQARVGLLALVGIAVMAGVGLIFRREPIIVLLLAGVCYQLAVSAVSHYIRPPINNQIVPMLCLALCWWQQRSTQTRQSEIVCSGRSPLLD